MALPRCPQTNDPMHDEEYRKQFLHVDGSINEGVLWLLQKNNPVGAGGVSGTAGNFIFLCIVVGILYFWMKSQQCFSPRENNTTERLKQMRALRSLQKLEEEEP